MPAHVQQAFKNVIWQKKNFFENFLISFVFIQEEESQWQDFAEDEVLVKDQLAEGLLQSLLADTLESFAKIYKKKARQEDPESPKWKLG